jgi:hypothetical protein
MNREGRGAFVEKCREKNRANSPPLETFMFFMIFMVKVPSAERSSGRSHAFWVLILDFRFAGGFTSIQPPAYFFPRISMAFFSCGSFSGSRTPRERFVKSAIRSSGVTSTSKSGISPPVPSPDRVKERPNGVK